MKNFLDDFPQDWSNPEYEELCGLLIRCVGSKGISYLSNLADMAGIAPGTFPMGYEDLRETSKALIKELGRQDKLRALVEKAALEPTRYQTDFSDLLKRPKKRSPKKLPEGEPAVDVAARDIREFLSEHFDDTEFSVFCHDYFREVSSDFTNAMTKGQKVEHLIGYCERREKIKDLMKALHIERPEQFHSFVRKQT